MSSPRRTSLRAHFHTRRGATGATLRCETGAFSGARRRQLLSREKPHTGEAAVGAANLQGPGPRPGAVLHGPVTSWGLVWSQPPHASQSDAQAESLVGGRGWPGSQLALRAGQCPPPSLDGLFLLPSTAQASAPSTTEAQAWRTRAQHREKHVHSGHCHGPSCPVKGLPVSAVSLNPGLSSSTYTR